MVIDLNLKIEIRGQATFDDVVDYISLSSGVGSCHTDNPLMGSPYIEADVVSGTIKEKGTKNIHIFKAKEKRAKPYADKEMKISMSLDSFTEENSFIHFMRYLPKWDGKDRVEEFKKLVPMYLVVYSGGGCGTSCISKLIIEVCKKNTDIVFCGTQGVGKSTLIRWLYPFEQTEIPSPYHRTEARRTPNGSILIETTHEPKNVRKKTSYCYLEQIDLSYTQIDIKQLYAQVLAEEKEKNKE